MPESPIGITSSEDVVISCGKCRGSFFGRIPTDILAYFWYFGDQELNCKSDKPISAWYPLKYTCGFSYQ